MGWTYSEEWAHRKDLIQERIQGNDWINPDTGIRCVNKILAYCMRGNNLWKVVESFRYDKDGNQIHHNRWIGLDLLQGGWNQPCWGYKDMDETCGPNAVNCPLAYLEMVKDFPTVSYGIAWRERVLEYHNAKKIAREAKKRDAKLTQAKFTVEHDEKNDFWGVYSGSFCLVNFLTKTEADETLKRMQG